MVNNEKNENQHTYDNGFHPKEVILKENFKFYLNNIFFKFFSTLLILITKFFLFFPKHLVWGFKIIGKKNKKYAKGSVIISNHIHQLDALILITSYPFKRIYCTTLQSNLGFGIVSKYFRLGGAVPIPNNLKLFKKFTKETKEALESKSSILVYPEASLMPYCDHIRPFLPGAFQFALNANAKILPTVYTFHKPKGIYKLTRRKKPCIHYNILNPYTIKDMGNRKLTMETAAKELNDMLSKYFIENSDYFS